MICVSRSAVPVARHAEPESGYGASFWYTYFSSLLVSIAVALLYRYADFVTVLGGGEFDLGWIVGIGMVGSLAMRLAIGAAIDTRGPRLIWLASTLLFIVACLAHLAIDKPNGVAIYFWRLVWACSVAGFFGSSTTFIGRKAPLARMAELVGMLGTSGFLGVMLGSLLGDLFFAGAAPSRAHTNRMFLAAAGLATLSLGLIWLATRGQRVRRRRSVPLWPILRRYQPGLVVLISVASGVSIGVPQTFLRPFALDRGIHNIGLFFTCYALAAIVMRIIARQWPARYGMERILVWGTGGMVVSTALFPLVGQTWHLILPGIGFGVSHALIFPSVVGLCSRTFPVRHRGLGTVLALATWDLGALIGAPLSGMVLHEAERLSLPAYPMMFLVMAALAGALGWLYVRQVWRSPATINAPPHAAARMHHRARRRKRVASRVP